MYHPRKANKVADALSRKSRVPVNDIMTVPWELYREMQSLGAMTVQPTLFDRIIEAQLEDPEIVELIHRVEDNETNAF